MKPKSKYDRTKFLCQALAKLLENAPHISCADESDAGEWVDQIDKLRRALAVELGDGSALGSAMAHFAELLGREDEVNAFVEKHAPPSESLSWIRLFDYARLAHETILGLKEDAAELVNARDAEIKELLAENAALKMVTEELRAEISRTPKKFRTIAA